MLHNCVIRFLTYLMKNIMMNNIIAKQVYNNLDANGIPTNYSYIASSCITLI